MRPEPIRPLHCPKCHGAFLPTSNNPENILPCPVCATMVRVGDCAPVRDFKMEYGGENWQMEADQKRLRRLAWHRKQSRWVGLAGAAVVVAGLGLAVGYGVLGRKKAEAAPPNQHRIALRKESAEAFAALKPAFAATDWTGLLPVVRNPDKVQPLMDWYYTQRGAYPVRKLFGHDREALGEWNGMPTLSMRLFCDGPAPLYVTMVKEADGWKLDWESFSNVHGKRWQYFLQKQGELPDPITIPVHVERLSLNLLVPGFYRDSGIVEAETDQAARIFVLDRNRDFAAACFARGSEVAKALLAGLEGDKVRRFVIEAKLKSVESHPPAVEVLRILRQGWDTPTAPQPELPHPTVAESR